MRLISGIIGHASPVDAVKIKKEFSHILTEGEEIHRAFKYIRDLVVFTDKRFVLVKKLDSLGSKINYHSVAYNKVLNFSVETSGTFEFEHALKLWCAGMSNPITLTFDRGFNIFELQSTIAKYVL
jgi:hypothetical protein